MLKLSCFDLFMRWLISICFYDKIVKICILLYWIEGDGIRDFSKFLEGDIIDVLGLFGKGFDID